MNKRKQKNFQVFLQDEEWSRFLEIFELARSRFKHPKLPFKKAYVIRRLVGLDPPDELVTQRDIDYFLGKSFASKQVMRELPSTETEISAEDTQPELQMQNRKLRNGD